ncbi:hypothetical protein [Cytobacillus gottheilii]|uniref:hypothetical protein n=1 Tax=Cytobacillus gottheilii TaxID=859144 RepID=UPI00082DBC91|nr:hypothetical protein [Cytobacillus gottheilii]
MISNGVRSTPLYSASRAALTSGATIKPSNSSHGEKGNPEVAKLTFTGSDAAATLNIDFGYTNVDVEVEAGDSNITVANKAFEKISTEAIFGYVASNNGDGSITFTSSFNSDMEDMEVNVKVKE